MQIDIHNYEAFFLDYKEGNLDAAQVKELFAFLEEYPQLKAELDNFEPVTLELEESFMDKSSLRKKEVSEEVLVAYVENGLDSRERVEVESLAAQNASFARELGLYRSTIVVADETIKFPRKNRLKKGGVVIFLQSNPAYLRVAAALLLLLGLFFLVSKLNTRQVPENNTPVLASEGGINNDKVPHEKKENVTPQKENRNLATLDKPGKDITQEKKKNNKAWNLSHHLNDEMPVVTSTLTVNTSTVLANNSKNGNPEIDSVAIVQVIPENKATYRSYFNYSAEDDEDENAHAKTEVTASAAAGKKTFFQKITNAARKVNAMGVKKVEGEEQSGTSSINIGGFVLSETISN
jgi:hypothetical protein